MYNVLMAADASLSASILDTETITAADRPARRNKSLCKRMLSVVPSIFAQTHPHDRIGLDWH